MSDNNAKRIGDELKSLVQGDVHVDIFHRLAFSSDASMYQMVPLCIVAPKDSDDVIAAVTYARDNDIPVVARGAGSGIAGESLGEGVMIDFRRYMNRILDYDKKSNVVQCEPGVVLDDLNNYLSQFGKKIGPDPSSSNRAVVGGVVANNSTGSHSPQYGYISNYVKWVDVVLADGSLIRASDDYELRSSNDKKLDEIAEGCIKILKGKEEVIEKALPKTKRNRCGYNIAGICNGQRINLAKLMASSECTLGIFTKIALQTVDVPDAVGLIQFEFDSLDNMAKAAPVIIDSGAATCELMDAEVIRMALKTYGSYKDVLPTDCAATLLVEHNGNSSEQVAEKIRQTDSLVGSLASGKSLAMEKSKQDRLWKARKDAVPLLSRAQGHKRPIGFMEDVSVENKKLAEYLRGLDKIGQKYNIKMAFYGHAGDGELHIRPFLDLSDPADVKKMRNLAEEVFELAWSLGGTISGEHGDGLVRAGFIEKQYGTEYYKLLCDIKKLFDPKHLMNPGKIISEDPDVMTNNIRASRKALDERIKKTVLLDPEQFRLEIGQCDGCGVCLSTTSGSRMCPVFRATGDELACSRAKANLVRAWATGLIDMNDFDSDDFKKIMSLCINCKACSLECPAGVDASKLVMEIRAQLAKKKKLSGAETVLSRNRLLSIVGSIFSPISNFVMRLAPFRTFLEKTAGLDRWATIPRFEFGSFVKKANSYLAKQPALTKSTDKAAYFVDSFANYNDHELGFAVLKVLRHNNIDVSVPLQRPAPLPAMVYGDIKTAKADLEYNVKHLADAVRQGYNIVCSEPSAALCLRDELKLLVDTEDAKLVSASVYELMDYLNRLYKFRRIQLPEALNITTDGKGSDPNQVREFAYHSPCHLCALGTAGVSIELLSKIKNINITDINAGCCGIAGTFGMQKKNIELSEKIASGVIEAIKSMNVEYVLTECAACKMQIERQTGKKVLHPIKLLAQAYGLIKKDK